MNRDVTKKTFRSAVLQHLSILFLSQAHDLYSNHAPTMPQLTNKLNHCKCQHNWGPCSYRPGQSQKTPLRKWSKNLLKRNVKNAEADAHECSASSIHVAWSPLSILSNRWMVNDLTTLSRLSLEMVAGVGSKQSKEGWRTHSEGWSLCRRLMPLALGRGERFSGTLPEKNNL